MFPRFITDYFVLIVRIGLVLVRVIASVVSQVIIVLPVAVAYAETIIRKVLVVDC